MRKFYQEKCNFLLNKESFESLRKNDTSPPVICTQVPYSIYTYDCKRPCPPPPLPKPKPPHNHCECHKNGCMPLPPLCPTPPQPCMPNPFPCGIPSYSCCIPTPLPCIPMLFIGFSICQTPTPCTPFVPKC